MTGDLSSGARNTEEPAQELRADADGGRASRFRILTIKGKRRAFALEPIFWSILEDAAEAQSMRLGEYASHLLEKASRTNHSALLRVKAVEWAEQRRDNLRDQGFLAIGRRIAASHSAPCFLIDQRGVIVSYNKPFGDLLGKDASNAADADGFNAQLSLGVDIADMVRILKANASKFLRVRFSLLFESYERSGVLNAMFVGGEEDNCFVICLVQSADEAVTRL